MNNIYLHEGPIGNDVVNEAIDLHASNKTRGGHAIFLGQVRDDLINDKKVLEIDYSAYEAMVGQETDKIKAEIRKKYEDVQGIFIKHSIGAVKAGEMSLFVLVSAGHRVEAFHALEDTVNMVKARVPVWKKELLDDGSHIWTEQS